MSAIICLSIPVTKYMQQGGNTSWLNLSSLCSDFKHSFLLSLLTFPLLQTFRHTLQLTFSFFRIHTIVSLALLPLGGRTECTRRYPNIAMYTSPLMWVLAPPSPIARACHVSLTYSSPKLSKSHLRLQKPVEFLLTLLRPIPLFPISPISSKYILLHLLS